MQVEGFRDHVATDDFFLDVSKKGECMWGGQLCNWIMMRRRGQCMGCAVREVHRTIKRAEMTASLCPPRRIVGPTTTHVGRTKESSMGFEEEK